MANFEQPRKRGKKLIQAAKAAPAVSGEAAAAQKNRQIEIRLGIIEGLGRLGISSDRWPDFVRSFSTDPQERIRYEARMTPPPYQPPEFDRLNQSYEDWAKLADQGWEQHLEKVWQDFQADVTKGVDEPIDPVKRTRSTGKKGHTPEKPGRGSNTPMERRYEWAAQYLLGVPLKEIAGADSEPSTVGRIARGILRAAHWAATPAQKRQ